MTNHLWQSRPVRLIRLAYGELCRLFLICVKNGRLRKKCSGAALVEYALIVSLIAIAAIWSLGSLGQVIRQKFNMIFSQFGQTSPDTGPVEQGGPTERPSEEPTEEPGTERPSREPTEEPTEEPSEEP